MKTKPAPSKAASNLDDTLSWLAAKTNCQPRQPDEFSVRDALSKCPQMTMGGMRNKLRDMVDKGELTSRPFQDGAYKIILFRRAVGK